MLRKAVQATLVYYDTLDYPLTAFETWKHLLIQGEDLSFEPTSLFTVTKALDELVSLGRIERHASFFTLPDRGELGTLRIQCEKQAVAKLKRASRLIRWCSWIPYIRMIAVTGSLSLKQGDRASDWDFFVVLKRGAIWTGRFCLTAWLELLGKRRHGKKIQDKACLNCYLSDDALEMPLRDLFSSHEYRFLYPVIGKETFRIFELTNRWMADYRPNLTLTEIPSIFLRPTGKWSQRLQEFFEALMPLTWLEPRLKAWQKRLIEKNPKTQLPGGYIEATDRALIFLPKPKGPQIFERFKERLSRV